MNMRRFVTATVLSLAVLAARPANAQLMVNGETISDAKTFNAAKKDGALLAYGIYPTE